ncbi:MAG TPA: methyltransferase domain-containing protein [Chitinophagales bacterium]|nr:methyltransferase domain-containing protein [Chitinophagales bacterium]
MNSYTHFKDILVCPYSLGPLTFMPDKAVSEVTKDEYPILDGQIDMRLKRAKNVTVDFVLGQELDTSKVSFKVIEDDPDATVNFDDMSVPHHLSRDVMSYFPKAKSPDCYALDLGSGTGLHQGVCERAGYKYISLDYNSKKASLKGDAHALPFADNTFDFIISISVMEHVQYPWIMTQEVRRVLKPGGRFIATLSFLEPFHDNSYYHVSHLGVLTNLKVGGFDKIKVLSPNYGWEGMEAVSIMHYFSALPWWLVRAIIWPYMALHKLWWKYAQITKKIHWHPFTPEYRLLASSGSFIFVVDK